MSAFSSLRRAVGPDLPCIAALHKQAYSRDHFTALLPTHTLEQYYGLFLDGGTQIVVAVGFHSDGTEQINGFAVFGTGIPEKIAAFKKACAHDILLTSAQHPVAAARKVLSGLWSRFGERASYVPADFLLLSIAAAPGVSGVGRQLLLAVTAAARLGGHGKVGLYVNADNLRATNAYCATGYRFRELVNGQFYMEVEVRSA